MYVCVCVSVCVCKGGGGGRGEGVVRTYDVCNKLYTMRHRQYCIRFVKIKLLYTLQFIV